MSFTLSNRFDDVSVHAPTNDEDDVYFTVRVDPGAEYGEHYVKLLIYSLRAALRSKKRLLVERGKLDEEPRR